MLSENKVFDYFVNLASLLCEAQHGTTVNVCALDMSKAFDKVNHVGLYIKLIKRMCLLHCWYDKCYLLQLQMLHSCD